MNVEDRIWNLIAKRMAGEANEKELAELQDLLRKYPEYTYTLQILEDLWKPAEPAKLMDPDEPPADKEEADNAFIKHLFRMAEAKTTGAHPSEAKTAKPGPLAAPSELTTPRFARARKRRSSLLPASGLLLNNLRTGWRNLKRNKTFSLINIMGLAIGMASAAVIMIWINNELSYDDFHPHKDRIYQLYNRSIVDGRLASWGGVPQPVRPLLKTDYPQIEAAARVQWVGAFVLSAGDTHLETRGYLADPDFFNIFNFSFEQGDPATALNDPRSIVLTKQMARKLFGSEDPIGKIVKVDSNARFKVTGVVKSIPDNSQFGFEYVMPWSYMEEAGWANQNWGNRGVPTYVRLKEGQSEEAVNKLLDPIIREHARDQKNEVFLHPLSKWRLYSRFENGKIVGGRIEIVRLLAILAGFILLIACINYVNLNTARSIRRSREIGIRKVAGAARGSLVAQFLGESILTALFAAFIGMLILRPLSHLLDRELEIPYTNPVFWLVAIAFTVFTGVLAGLYPALHLSGFNPIKALKGQLRSVGTLITPRKILVVFQFSFAIILIISTVVVYQQLNYVENRDAGYQKNDLAYVYIKGDIRKNYDIIRKELLASGAVTSVTASNSPITDIWEWDDGFSWEGKDPAARQTICRFQTDGDFARTMGLSLLAGRDINTFEHPEDSTAILLNESAVKMIGPSARVGQIIKNGNRVFHIIGIVRNFIPGSPFEQVDPLVIEGPGTNMGAMTFKLNKDNTNAYDMKRIAEIFHTYNPEYPFNMRYVAESYEEKFGGAMHTGTLAAYFTGLTVFISCLGLLALAICMGESRLKEIGVRKVLGASVGGIAVLISREFLKLIVISIAIATPIAWYLMHNWLQDYSYRISISGWVFVFSAGLSMLIAIATIGYQAIKAGRTSPVKSLRAD